MIFLKAFPQQWGEAFLENWADHSKAWALESGFFTPALAQVVEHTTSDLKDPGSNHYSGNETASVFLSHIKAT